MSGNNNDTKILNKWAVSRDSFNIMGQIPNCEEVLNDDKYFTIEAVNYDAAKTLRDKLEAEKFTTKSIEIEKLLCIINNMERSHGSSNISPILLKKIIKENL